MPYSPRPSQPPGNSNPPCVTDAEDERWVGEGGGVSPSAHGAGNDERDLSHPPSLGQGRPAFAQTVDADDPQEAEKLTEAGRDDDLGEGD